MKYRYFFLILLTVLVFGGCQRSNWQPADSQNFGQNEASSQSLASSTPQATKSDSPAEFRPSGATSSGPEIQPSPKPAVTVKPTKLILDYPVAFVPQAPYQVWDALHEEACEEAAIITVVKYFKNEPVSTHLAEQAILDLVAWEQENNYAVDLNAAETVEILKGQYGLQAELETNVTVERIKQVLQAGKLVIVPAAGRQLGNPNFKRPGPIYHMLVIRGYDDQAGEFITNDPGTRKGEGYRYNYQTLIKAIHDWDHALAEDGMTDEEIDQGQKIIIITSL